MSDERVKSQAKVMLVTGGAQGIGRGVVTHMLHRGWRVIVFDADREALDALEEELPEMASSLRCFEVDVSSEEQVAAAFAQLAEDGEGLDALVNNAALADPYNAPLEELELEVWQRYIDVNLTGYFLVSKYAIPLLRERRGAIVHMASTRAHQSEPHHEAYASAKGGVVALTHAMAISLGPEIRVNTILPSWIEVSALKKPSEREQVELSEEDHAQHPVGRVGRASDIAQAVAFLVDGAASGFMTGQELVLDGGMTKKMIYTE